MLGVSGTVLWFSCAWQCLDVVHCWFRCGSCVCGMVYIWVRCVWSSVVVQLSVAWFIGGSVLVQLQFTCMSEFDMVG